MARQIVRDRRWVALMLLLVACAAGGWWANRWPTNPKIALRDGTELTLQAVTFGMSSPRPETPFIPHRMAGVQFELGKAAETSAPEPVMRVQGATDNQGRPLDHVALVPEPLEGAGKWRLSVEEQRNPPQAGITSMNVTIAFPDQRHFEFIVPSRRARE